MAGGTLAGSAGPERGRDRRPRRVGDLIFVGLSAAAAITVVALLAALVLLLLQQSSEAFRTFGPGFLASQSWHPTPPPEAYGALPYLYGTLVTSAIAMLLGVPLSLGIAIFLSELSPSWLRLPLTVLVELLAAIPSVIYGLWAFYVLVPVVRDTLEPNLHATLGWTGVFGAPGSGFGFFTAGLVLSVMVVPTISAVSRDAMVAVPSSQREAALSLGATRWEATRIGVLSYARSGIFGACILGLGRALGETMAVTMTIGNVANVTGNTFSTGQSIASQIATTFQEASGLQLSSLIALAAILLGVTLLINAAARLILSRSVLTEGARE